MFGSHAECVLARVTLDCVLVRVLLATLVVVLAALLLLECVLSKNHTSKCLPPSLYNAPDRLCMPRLQLDFYCSKCHTPICFHGTVKDHAGHDWGLLTDVVSNHTAELCTEAERVSVMQTKLEQGIARIKVVEEELVVEARTQKENITAHFAHLVEVLRAREQELMREVEETQARKQKILAGQREGLEHAVASMASGSEHALRTSKLGDVFEVMLAYSHIVGGMRAICDKDYQLHPNTSASIRFVDTSGGSMSESLAQHARIVAREVCPAACTAEGGGLKEICITHTAEFTVQAVDFQGQACTEGGDTVQIKLCGAGDRQVLGHADLTKDAGVVDRGDGTYGCTYSLVAGAHEQEEALRGTREWPTCVRQSFYTGHQERGGAEIRGAV